MTNTTYRGFLGDADRDFRIAPELFAELERKTGVGLCALCRRLFAGTFNAADVTETIRLALIGGGEAPASAATIVATYVTGRPFAESYPLAVSILEALWFGAKPAPAVATGAPDAAA